MPAQAGAPSCVASSVVMCSFCAGSTAKVFSAPSSAYARKLHADVPSLNPNRYAALRDPGFGRLRTGAAAVPKIQVSAITKTFEVGGKALKAVDDVSFTVPAGTTHALVGESGSGKTTTIRLLLGLEEPDTGNISVAGEQVTGRSHQSLRDVRRHLQLVYQNPFTSLDPTWKVELLVREPLGPREVAAIVLTLSGTALALRPQAATAPLDAAPDRG